MVGDYINKSQSINTEFYCDYINLLASKEVSESGKLSLNKLVDFLKIIINLFFQLVRKRPNICYLALTVTGLAFFRDVVIVMLLKVFRIKRVYHLHNKGVSKFQNKKLYRYFYSFVFKDAEVIILSKYLYPDIKDFVSENKVHVCPNGIPYNKKQRGQGQEKNSRFPTILFLSNLIESKGVFLLLEACSRLRGKGLDFQCLFVGGVGDITVEVFNEQVRSKGLVDNVKYLGRKYGDEKDEIFSSADIFAFPTYYYYETFGLVNLEAMQYELPVISTYEGGIPDIIDDGKTGFLIPQKDVEALTEKLETLIKDPDLRRKMGVAGRKKFEERFTLQKFEENLIKSIKLSI